MDRLSIACLRSIQVTLAGKQITNFRGNKALALLLYLVVEADRPHRREKLAGLFWPDQPESAARHNLGQTLVNLRNAIHDRNANPSFLLITRQTIQFNPASTFWLDLAILESHLTTLQDQFHKQATQHATLITQLQAALALYQTPFLEGFSLNDSAPFEEWVTIKREWLHQQIINVSGQLIDRLLEQKNYRHVEPLIRQRLALDSLDEDAHHQLIHTLASTGQRNAALTHYQNYCQLLETELGVAPSPQTTALYKGILTDSRSTLALTNEHTAPIERHLQDWGSAPKNHTFYGRQKELRVLKDWLATEQYRVVALVAMGGMGKTTLAAKVATELTNEFTYIFWRSLVNAPPLTDLLAECLDFFSNQHINHQTLSLDGQLQHLMTYLRQQRCLIVLDNIESIFQSGERSSSYRPGYEAYSQLINQLGTFEHQSCLLLTSRERPRELLNLESEARIVRTMYLAGLDERSGWEILKAHCHSCQQAVGNTLIRRYSGNPLALRLVSETIEDLFTGDIEAFLKEETPIFDDIRDILDQQFTRLPPLEHKIMCWLAIERYMVTIQQLERNLIHPAPRRHLLEALRSLQRRSLLEKIGDGFTLQNVVMEYVTSYVVDHMYHDIVLNRLDHFAQYSLIKAQTPEYIRQSQTCLLLEPVAERLLNTLGHTRLQHTLQQLLAKLHTDMAQIPGYAGGNLLNLLVFLGYDLQGYDFSQLAVWHAYLRGVALPQVNFTGADLTASIFTNTFGFVTSVAFSPDNRLLAAATGDNDIHLWDVATHQPLSRCRGHTNLVWALAFSPDGRTLASGSWDKTVRLWDIHAGCTPTILHGHADRIRAIAFSPDGTILASGGEDYLIYLWDRANEHQPTMLSGHTHAIRTLAFSPDGTILASGGKDERIFVWNVHMEQQVATLSGHQGGVWSVTFSPDGQTLASGGEDQTVCLWDIAHAQCYRTFHGHNGAVWSITFSPDNTLLASSGEDQTVRLWNITTGQATSTLRGHSEGVWAVTFSPDGQTLASGGEDQTVCLWDVLNRRLRHTLRGHTNWIYHVAFSPDGQTLASGSWDRKVCVWDAVLGELYRTLSAHTGRVRTIAFSPDGTMLASGSEDQKICLWDIASGQLQTVLHQHSDWVRTLAFSSDGITLVSGSADQTICLWDLPNGHLRTTLTGHTQSVNALAISADGTTLVSGSADQTICLWDLPNGYLHTTLNGHTNWVWSVALSPDSKLLVSGGADQTVRVWDMKHGQLCHTLLGHTNWVLSVAFNPDGQTLVSSSVDGTMRIWDIRTGQCLEVLQADRPYTGMNITHATGLTEEQRVSLKALGAIEEHPAYARVANR
ncbi:MAG: hypothetical protein GFH23_1086666n25 [Chloroflexi bacterium AL-N1]|nr:hypothetical protein [Chloroflexi bacterium AL-N1]NOK91983.1 hypothetical protein [Chloroflexi bacterium AL-N15]